MKRTSIGFNDTLFEWLTQHAKEQGLTQSDIVRRALDLYRKHIKEEEK